MSNSHSIPIRPAGSTFPKDGFFPPPTSAERPSLSDYLAEINLWRQVVRTIVEDIESLEIAGVSTQAARSELSELSSSLRGMKGTILIVFPDHGWKIYHKLKTRIENLQQSSILEKQMAEKEADNAIVAMFQEFI